MSSTTTIRVAGFGGQGVMLFGQLLSYAATAANLNTIWYPSYGPETRGGTANCSVVISKETINSPVFRHANHLVLFNTPSLDKFKDDVTPGGLIVYNSSLIDAFTPPSGVTAVGVPINDIAAQLGNPKVINMVLLGAYLELTKMFTNDDIIQRIRYLWGESKAHLIAINEAALSEGMNHVRQQGVVYAASFV